MFFDLYIYFKLYYILNYLSNYCVFQLTIFQLGTKKIDYLAYISTVLLIFKSYHTFILINQIILSVLFINL